MNFYGIYKGIIEKLDIYSGGDKTNFVSISDCYAASMNIVLKAC